MKFLPFILRMKIFSKLIHEIQPMDFCKSLNSGHEFCNGNNTWPELEIWKTDSAEF